MVLHCNAGLLFLGGGDSKPHFFGGGHSIGLLVHFVTIHDCCIFVRFRTSVTTLVGYSVELLPSN